ncbi:hypothetical protein J3D52_004249 [Achromobacter insolitus]|nr:hypothetical protein [Achromobacter insolitus]
MRCWSRGQGRFLYCPPFSAARAAGNGIHGFLNFDCVRLRECDKWLAIGPQLLGVGGDGWRATCNRLRMQIRTRATHPTSALSGDYWQTGAWPSSRHRASQNRTRFSLAIRITTRTPRHQRAAPSRDARHGVSPKRPPARPAWGGPRKTRQPHSFVARTPSTPPAPAPVKFQPAEPVASAACGARGVDKPEGIRRQPPQAATRMRMGGAALGKSGANAPDRNRCPAPRRPPTRQASQEPTNQQPKNQPTNAPPAAPSPPRTPTPQH